FPERIVRLGDMEIDQFRLTLSAMLRVRRYLLVASFVSHLITVPGCSTSPQVKQAKFMNGGEQAMAKGKYEEAVVQFRNAVKIDPQLSEAHLWLGRAHSNLGSQSSAIAEFHQTLLLDPQNSEAKLELAPLLVAGGEYDRAETLLRQVIKYQPRNSRARALLGQR